MPADNKYVKFRRSCSVKLRKTYWEITVVKSVSFGKFACFRLSALQRELFMFEFFYDILNITKDEN